MKGLLPKTFGVPVSVWSMVIVFIHYTEFNEEQIKFHIYPIK